MIRFSIITVVFNNKTGLERTIESVLSQDYINYEYIIIDGGSTDGSIDVIKKNASQITYWVSEPDGGVYDGMNKAIQIAKGEHCIFMNSGDEFYDSTVLSDVEKYGNFYDLGVGVSLNTINQKEICKVYPPKELSLLFFENYSFTHQAAFMRTSLLKEFPYDTRYRIVADWKHMLTLYLKRIYRYQALPIIICKFEGGGLSDNTEKRNVEREKALAELLSPMLLKDATAMKGLRLTAVDNELLSLLCHVLESRTLTKWLKNIMKVLCKIR